MRRTLFALLMAVFIVGVPAVQPAATVSTSPAQLAPLWIDPGPTPRDLLNGVAGTLPKPAVDGRYTVIKKDTAGFSISYRVTDDRQREWSVKIGPEAQTEVVASRILWAVGYHQLPSYFVERWIAVDRSEGRVEGQVLGGGRFRPRDLGLQSRGIWSWKENPFVGSRPYNGLLVLLVILNSTDLKDDNNEVFDVERGPREGARTWYVVKDLGASLGETGRMDPRRGYLEGFEREPFITGVEGRQVTFGFRGRHQELLERIGVEDVRWACERLRRLTDRQWRDAFHAGGYSDEQTDRFVRRIKQKVEEGLALR